MASAITIAIFMALCFLPLLVTPKDGRFRRPIVAGCVILAVLLIPALKWDRGQDVMVVAWVGMIVVGIFGGKGKEG